MSRTSTTDPQLIEDSGKTRELTGAIKKLTWVLASLTLVLILLALPVAIESIRNLIL